QAREYLGNEYSESMSFEELQLLTIRTLKEVIEGDLDSNRFEIAVIDAKDRKWKLLSIKENQTLLEKITD
ncbi:MAG: hypothetical protein ACTSX0_08735, partial [Promethearchaeota archaeon]